MSAEGFVFPACTLAAVAEALSEDPFYMAIVATRVAPEEKKRVLMQYLDYSLQEGARTGRTVAVDEGAATWSLPITDKAVAEAEGVAKARYMQDLLGPDYESYTKINEFMSAQTTGSPYEGAWYLSILGVLPRRQRSGVGRQLLAETLREADEAGADCFLETFDDNKGFYNKLGFESVATHVIPHISAAYTIMARKPQK